MEKQKKLYGGNITLQVFTTVDANEDLVQERNNAHLDLDLDLFAKLRKLIVDQGYDVSVVGADLHFIDDADEAEIDLVNKRKEAAKKRRKESTLRIQL